MQLIGSNQSGDYSHDYSLLFFLFCQAQPQLNSIQHNFKLNFETEIALFSDNTATQPPTLALGDTPKIINQKSIFQGF